MKNFFKDKKANKQKLSDYGFVNGEYSTDIMSGEFKLIIKLGKNNEIKTELIEISTG